MSFANDQPPKRNLTPRAIRPSILPPTTDFYPYEYLASLLAYIPPQNHLPLIPVSHSSPTSSSPSYSSPKSTTGAIKRRSTDTGSARHRKRTRNPPAPISSFPNLAPRPGPHQPDLWDVIDRITKPGRKGDKGRKKLEGRGGDDKKVRPDVKWENRKMSARIDNKWKPAAYHLAFREMFILMNEQQPGAPAWQKSKGLDYTSYSAATSDWNSDPRSIKDSQGRQVFFMDQPPADYTHHRKTAYLQCEGLVVLDHNNRPIKDYPGAPLTLESKAPAWLLEGLRRCFGMTVYDLKARMLPLLDTPTGPERLHGYTSYTNEFLRWRNDENKKTIERGGTDMIVPWHIRNKRQSAKENANDESRIKAEEDSQDDEYYGTDSVSDPVPTRSTNVNETTIGHVDSPYSSSLATSAPMPVSNRNANHQSQQSRPTLPPNECWGRSGTSAESHSRGQTRSMSMNETTRGHVYSPYTFSLGTSAPMSPYTSSLGTSAPMSPHTSSLETSAPMLSLNGYSPQQSQQSRSILPQNGLNQSSGASNMPAESHSRGQTRSVSMSDSTGGHVDHPYTSSPANSEPNGYAQYQPQQSHSVIPLSGLNQLSEASDIAAGYYSIGQPKSEYVEQTWGGNQSNAPTFPGTNLLAQTANTVPSGSIYSAGYPSTFTELNINPTAEYACDYSSANTFPDLESYTPAPADYGLVAVPQLGHHSQQKTANEYSIDGSLHHELRLHQPLHVDTSTPIYRMQGPHALNTACSGPSGSEPNTSLSTPIDPWMGSQWSPCTREDFLREENFLPQSP